MIPTVVAVVAIIVIFKVNIQKYVGVMLRLDTSAKTLGDYPHFQKLGGVLL
nr:MAG TPA: hypothetical protein [Crassvirales sp.]